jgi:cytochrome P450
MFQPVESSPWDVFSATFQADPYPTYARIREESPVLPLARGPLRFVLLSRYDDCVAVLRDPRFSAMKFPEGLVTLALHGPDPDLASLARVVSNVMLVKDGPDHARLRGLVNKAFTPRVVEALRDRIETLVQELLDEADRRGGLELIHDFASPLPVAVIAELLGLPARDRRQVKTWSDALVPVLDGTLRDAHLATVASAASEFRAYLKDVVEQRRKDPGDDLLSGMIAAHEHDDALTEDELLASAILLLGAGHETTTNLIGNGMLALLRHPAELARLGRDRSLVKGAVEELLRFDSPVQTTSRVAKEDVEIRDVRIPAGIEVNTLIGSANRDPAQFPEPDRLDLGRADVRHLAFGHGPHFCLGASLARLEAQIAFERLLHRFPKIEQSAEPRHKPGLVLRGLEELRLEVG